MLYNPTWGDLFVDEIGMMYLMDSTHKKVIKKYTTQSHKDRYDFTYRGRRVLVSRKKLIAVVWNNEDPDKKQHYDFLDGDVTNYHYTNIKSKVECTNAKHSYELDIIHKLENQEKIQEMINRLSNDVDHLLLCLTDVKNTLKVLEDETR